MKIMITGASGMLADAVISELEVSGGVVFGSPVEIVKTDIRPRQPDIRTLDICEREACRKFIQSESPDFIFHLAAETNVDLCEMQPDHAYRVNYIGTENLALICQQTDIVLAHISTANIFDGNKTDFYLEYDATNPVNTYGKSKLWGEMTVQRMLKKYFIVRPGWMLGGWDIDKKFVYKIVRQLQEGKKTLQVVHDKFGSPTFTVDFAKNLLTLVKSEQYGLYHMANKGGASRYDMAMKIVEFMGLTGKVNIESVDSSQFPLPAMRPRSEMIRNYHLELLGMNYMPSWEDSLKLYIINNIGH